VTTGHAHVNKPLTPDDYLDQATRVLDWSALAPWISAVETRAGIPVSISLYKMILLERWFQLAGADLDDACHGRAAFRRFLGAPLHGPVAEVWMHRQFAPKLAIAAEEITQLVTAVELLLADRGLPINPKAWEDSNAGSDPGPIEGIQTTVFEPGKLSAIAADAETAGRFARGSQIGSAAEDTETDLKPEPRTLATAVLIWPWGATTLIDRPLKIGRDPAYSTFARQLWADPRISRRHAEIEPQPDGLLLRDLGSSNGTYIDDELLPARSSILITSDIQLRFGTDLAVKLVFLPVRSATPG